MKKRYMIVKTSKVLTERTGSMLTEACYEIVDKGYETPDLAYKVKEMYSNPQHYIITAYWY